MFVISNCYNLFEQAKTQLVKGQNTEWDISGDDDKPKYIFERENISVLDPFSLLKRSPFFETFSEDEIKKISKFVEKQWYLKGDIIFKQGEETTGFDILAYGKTANYFYSKDENEKLSEEEIEDSSIISTISRPGYIVRWKISGDNPTNESTAIAVQDSVIYHIKLSNLLNVIEQDSHTAMKFTVRLLWLVSIRLRNLRARLISRGYEGEVLSVQNLIDQNSTQLSVSSPLHKLPHLLSNTITLDSAFETLSYLEKEGDTLEKGLAGLCFDILGKVHREYEFFEGLKHVYQSVSEAPKQLSAKDIRLLAAKQFVSVFERIPFVIDGWSNLPDDPGNIFIYNHLYNHPFNTLPNNFQITLDSHFISSMILYKRYGHPGIRVVRVPKDQEYGHQNYYDRLGHINVYTSESEKISESEKTQKLRRKEFYKLAANHIKTGESLALSPEGTSFSTEKSPGEFKLGTFLLASSIEPEPFIIPIAIANFDKRVNQNVFSVVIKKPFRISDFVVDPLNNKEKLYNFLVEYRNEYRNYVEEAISLAEKKVKNKRFSTDFEEVKKNNLVIDKNIFEQDVVNLEKKRVGKNDNSTVFYGSSTFRLWMSMKKDFSNFNILNLSFGGARIDYCLYYFDRLIKPNKIKSFVFYAGDNDIGDGKLPKNVLDSFISFYYKFREHFPKTHFTFVSIKPSIERLAFIERIEASNKLIRGFLSDQPNTFYLNIFDYMFDKDGEVIRELFTNDNLHMSRKGYLIWKDKFLENADNIF